MDIPGWRDGRRVSIREGRVAVVVVEERWVGRCAGWDDDDDDGVGRVGSFVVGGPRGSSSSSASLEDASSSSS